MSKIILVNGKKRSGKDFFAKKLQQEFKKNDKTSEILSFAGPLKDIVATSFGITMEDLDDYKNNSDNIYLNGSNLPITNFRLFLQIFGTEATKKHFGEDVWVKLLLNKVKDSDSDFVIVPDFRFLIENIGDCTVKVRNSDADSAQDNHSSETELNDFAFDYEINNNGYRDISKDVSEFVQNFLLDY